MMIRKTDPESVAPYLKDASNFSGGVADEVVIPENVEELRSFLKSNRDPVTVSGAGTGLTASRIPLSGSILSLERFKTIGEIDNASITVGSAVTLHDLQFHLEGSGYFYPPNPTESLASIGGTIATNASGSRSFKFGPTRDYVQELEFVLADGRCARLARNHKIDWPLELSDGSKITFPEVTFQSPLIKNASGYYVRPEMDWLDLFIGSDGTLAVITEAKLRLLPAPVNFISGVIFCSEEKFCWQLVDSIRTEGKDKISPCSIEYFDSFSLKRLKVEFTNIPDSAQGALFFEQEVMSEDDYDPLLENWYEFLESKDVLLEDSWFAQSQRDIRRFHEFRHNLPLMLNEENSRLGRVKIGTDMAVSDEYFLDMMRFYKDVLSQSGLEYVVFGHIGDNHLHINLLPGKEDIDRAKKTYQTLVEQILRWNGTVSAEHGIGKLKKEYFSQMVGEEVLQEMRRIKKCLDPNWVLGLGNIM